MSQILIPLFYWLHSLATVVFIGHYVLLVLIYLPVLNAGGGTFLSQISNRSRGWLYLSLLIFMVTGIYLMIADPNYMGVGDFTNFWSVMMLVKHILILGMIAWGFYFNAILRGGPQLGVSDVGEQAMLHFRRYVNVMSILGVLVLLLTALSQAQ